MQKKNITLNGIDRLTPETDALGRDSNALEILFLFFQILFSLNLRWI